MANHDTIVSSDKLSAIADAIRDKTGKSDALTLDQMPEEIESISTGGATPQCGIVPTSWASNGLVLSANSYGDVPVAALSTITANSYTYFSSDPHNYAPESINTSQTDLPVTDEIVLNTYTYINSLSFQTVPRIIGSQAFLGCCWLELNELPEGITVIGSMAFYNCFNVCISTIPSTVTYIGDEAFYDCGLSYRTTPYYSNEATYNIGDIICSDAQNDYYYTCVVPVTSPEEFDSNKWVLGCYPEIVGIYDSTQSYNTGDIVYDPNTASDSSGNTILNYMSTKFSYSYSPEVTGIVQATDYVVGDVVADSNDHIYTCYVNVSASEAMDLDSSHWISGCYPQILGEFDPNYNYSVGDCWVASTGYVVTCSSAGVGDSVKYTGGYFPGIELYQNTSTYKMGDVVLYGNDIPSRHAWTCIADISIPEEFDSNKWLSMYFPGMLYGYDPNKSYSIGDVLYEPTMGLYTCIENNTVGISPDDDPDNHWMSGYAPNILGKYSVTTAYTVGSVVAVNHDGFSAYTCIRSTNPAIAVLDSYCPNLVGMYDPTHIYNPGDAVMYFGEATILDDEISYYNNLYICISNENVSGKFDSTRWYNMSASGNCKISKLTFLGTPEYIDSGAFNESTYDPELGYLLALVPWSSENNPQGFNESSFIAVIHDYPVQ